jgi:hypothetical protein
LRRSGDRPRGRPSSLRTTGRVNGCHGLCEALGREGMLPGWLWASARVRKLVPPVCCSTAARRPDACNPTWQNRCTCYVAGLWGGSRLRAAPGGHGGGRLPCEVATQNTPQQALRLVARPHMCPTIYHGSVACAPGHEGLVWATCPTLPTRNWRRDSVPKRRGIKHVHRSRCA